MKPFNLDLKNDRIEFIDSRFYQTPNGGCVPSVTTILNAYPKDAQFYAWVKEVGENADTIRDEAGKRGSNVHNLTEKYDAGENVTFIGESGYPKFKMLEWAMFERYVDYTTRFNPIISMMESHMVSEELGFAGTLDRVIQIDGQTILMDIKTSNNLHETYWLQLAAYRKLLEQYDSSIKIDKVGILWLNAKTRTNGKPGDMQGVGWQMITRSNEECQTTDYDMFINVLDLWKSINKNMKPRQMSYKLSHKKQ